MKVSDSVSREVFGNAEKPPEWPTKGRMCAEDLLCSLILTRATCALLWRHAGPQREAAAWSGLFESLPFRAAFLVVLLLLYPRFSGNFPP